MDGDPEFAGGVQHPAPHDTRQQALLEGILKKVNDAMALVASKDNYAVIFEKAALAYAQEKLDVTDKVLQELERMQ